MKTLIAALLMVPFFGSFAMADGSSRKLEFAPFGKYLSRVEFAQSLLKANSLANGSKSRVDYSVNSDSRTTIEVFHVMVVGRSPTEESPETCYKAEFDFKAINSGWQVEAGPVTSEQIACAEYNGFAD